LSFQNLKVIEPILRALNNEGYTTPTPIQEQAIPLVLQRKDLFGCARTGTGKTAAFAIPVLQILHEQKQAAKAPDNTIKALILTPTRELAIQIKESLDTYGKFTGLRHAVIFGGVSQQAQVTTLRRGVDILVATPGRLLDLIDQRFVNLGSIRLLILDEADRMLDMGFVHDVKKIMAKVPAQRQTLFFSATMAPAIRQLANTLLTNPVHIEITPVSSTAETVSQAIYFVQKSSKQSLLKHLLAETGIPMTLVFTRTKHGADRVARELNSAGISAAAIHGNKSQQARQTALLKFRSRQIQVLVATDIAARGIDIDELTHVINYDLPEVAETYVHRIGRTGRAGANGMAVSFCDQEEKAYLRDIEKLIKKSVPVISEHPFKNTTNAGNNRPDFRPIGNNNRSAGNNRSGGHFSTRNRNRSGFKRAVKS
jgi:ATP-dependent RNA helicase RhlE